MPPKYEEPKTCKSGLECWTKGCPFKHPEGWSYDGPAAIAAKQKKPLGDCKNGLDCWKKDCKFKHPSGWRYASASSVPTPAPAPAPAVGAKKPSAGSWEKYGQDTHESASSVPTPAPAPAVGAKPDQKPFAGSWSKYGQDSQGKKDLPEVTKESPGQEVAVECGQETQSKKELPEVTMDSSFEYMEQVCDTSKGETTIRAWIEILQKKNIQSFKGDPVPAVQMCEQMTAYSTMGQKVVSLAQSLGSSAANQTMLWLVSRGSAVGVPLGMVQRYGAEVAKANQEYQVLLRLAKEVDNDLSETFQGLAKKGGATLPEPVKDSIEGLIDVLHKCARKFKNASSGGFGKWLVTHLPLPGGLGKAKSSAKECMELQLQLERAKNNVTWKFVCQMIAMYKEESDASTEEVPETDAKVGAGACSAASSALYNACCKGDADQARAQIKAGANVDFSLENGWTPLCTASGNGHFKCVGVLLENGANVNKALQNGVTPLKEACFKNHPKCARLLIERKAAVDAADYKGWTPLLAACHQGHPECVKVLLNAGANPNKSLPNGETPLKQACRYNHPACAQLLVSCNADVNAADKAGWTPLLIACELGHSDCINVLVWANADVNKPLNGSSSLNYGCTPLLIALVRGHIRCVTLLLQAGADVNTAVPKTGVTPLIKACLNRDVECAQLLLEHGADVNAADKNGWTPLLQTCDSGYTECVEVLLRGGADVKKALPGSPAFTPLYFATKSNHVDCIALLKRRSGTGGAKAWRPLVILPVLCLLTGLVLSASKKL